MPVTELRSNNILHAMKSGQKVGKPEEGNDSLDNYIRQAIGKEPVLSFSRAENNHVQWIQLLHALDQPDLPGWPLLSPPKAQMQKCDKCTKEFCSPINYRRHIRVHRRSLKIDKDSTKHRDFLGAFWDKLSFDEAKEVVSFKNVTLEEVPGSSVIKALTSFIRKPGFLSLPQVYVKAGAALLDVVQARPSRFPISSQELFDILDDASERTFLCAGTAESIQKFVFDGEAGKIGLEMKNLVACTSFLMEQKLIKAWHADKDAEALRCEKLLVEEEEAAQKRQAELLERRRLKKLRQKEQKAKEQTEGDEEDSKEESPDSSECLPSGETSSSLITSAWKDLTDPAEQNLEPVSVLNTNEEVDSRFQTGFDDAHIECGRGAEEQNGDHRMQQGSSWRHQIVARRPVSSSQRGGQNGFHLGQPHPVSKLGPVLKQGTHKDQRVVSLANGHKDQRVATLANGHKDQKAPSLNNGHKVWTRKTKPDIEVENLNVRVQRESRDQPELNENHEVLIGSISVTLRDSNGWCQGAIPAAPVDQCAIDNQHPHPKSGHEKRVKPDSGQSGSNKSMVKLWRPVGRHDAGNTVAVQYEKREVEVDTDTSKVGNTPCASDHDNNVAGRMDSSAGLEESENPRGLRLFSSRDAEAFLARRWKEAIAADHVRLVLLPETEPPDSYEIINPDILCSAENRLPSAGSPQPVVHGSAKTNSKTKPEKSARLKYIPKQQKNSST